jgi:hypothetical protein
LELDDQTYGDCVANFFQVEPKKGETVGLDGKVLCGSYNVETGANRTDSHPAIQLVTVYVVERGMILPPQQVDCKTNEIKAIPPVLEALAQREFQSESQIHTVETGHYVRDVPQGENASRIRVGDLPTIFAIARHLALNLYRDSGAKNMTQAQRLAGHGLDTLKKLFRMK